MALKLLIYHLSLIIRKSAGFTLIELMVVLSVTAVLGTLGIAGFTTYNQIQTLQSAASDVVRVLNLAKSRAQSQIKPSALCGPSEKLNAYLVKILVPNKYTLYLRCSRINKQVYEETKILPSDLSFDHNVSFYFPILRGGVVENEDEIIIDGYGRSKVITVNSLGRIIVE